MGESARQYLCVDAGGTKTVAAISDQWGNIIARGRGGPANLAELGMATTAREIMLAIDEARSTFASSSQSTKRHFDRAWIGISGCDTPKDVERAQSYFSSYFSPSTRLTLMNDALLLSYPLFPTAPLQPLTPPTPPHTPPSSRPWALAVVAGTGSICLALTLDASGSPIAFAKRGGYGHLFADKGSGYHLGLRGIELCVEAYESDKEEVGGLAESIRQTWGVSSTDDLPSRAHDLPPDLDPVSASNARKLHISRLSPLVLWLAFPHSTSSPNGPTTPTPCPLARQAVQDVANALAKDIAVLVSQANALGYSASPSLVVTGGLGVQPDYQRVLLRCLEESGLSLHEVVSVPQAAESGAKALALLGSAS